MPRLVAFYIRHCVLGFIVSALFVGALLYLNVGNLWHLVTHSDVGWLAVALLWLFNGIVFAGVQFGIAVMALGDRPTPKGGRLVRLVPAYAEALQKRRR